MYTVGERTYPLCPYCYAEANEKPEAPSLPPPSMVKDKSETSAGKQQQQGNESKPSKGQEYPAEQLLNKQKQRKQREEQQREREQNQQQAQAQPMEVDQGSQPTRSKSGRARPGFQVYRPPSARQNVENNADNANAQGSALRRSFRWVVASAYAVPLLVPMTMPMPRLMQK